MKQRFLSLMGGVFIVLILLGTLFVGIMYAQGPGWMGGGPGQGMGYTQNYTGTAPYGPGMMGGRGPGMMGYGQGYSGTVPYGPGMMGGYGPGMMGYGQGYTGTVPYGPGMMGGYGGSGMMGGYGGSGMMGGYGGPGMMGGYGGPGMMGGHGMMGGYGCGGYNASNPFTAVEPLSLAEAEEAVTEYLSTLNDENLVLGEIMIFENHAYAQILEEDSEMGAMELLVDPVTMAVYPEMGPNMMWNLKYGMMSGFGYNADTASAEMPLSAEAAMEAAQQYLDTYLGNNLQVEDHITPFYGYYTLHVGREGETIGMLSVHGYSGQVFLHTWHDDFVELSEGTHE